MARLRPGKLGACYSPVDWSMINQRGWRERSLGIRGGTGREVPFLPESGDRPLSVPPPERRGNSFFCCPLGHFSGIKPFVGCGASAFFIPHEVRTETIFPESGTVLLGQKKVRRFPPFSPLSVLSTRKVRPLPQCSLGSILL
jgi:hypothetical protein